MKLQDTSGHSFLKESSWERDNLGSIKRLKTEKDLTFKKYKDCENIKLPLTWNLDEARISPLIQQRRSTRKYADNQLLLENLAFILWASQGITAQIGKHFLRATPSAGALYPFETYLIVNKVEGLVPGLYHFNVLDFSLEFIKDEPVSEQFSQACLKQKFINDAAVSLVWTGVLSRCFGKYGERALRYLMLDLGHVCQNVIMASEAVGCGGCPIAAFFDSEVNDLLEVDGEDELVLYAASIGKKLLKEKEIE